MNKTVKTFVTLINDKYDEVSKDYSAMKTNDDVTKATRNNRLFHFNRERKVLSLIKELLTSMPDEAKLSDDAVEVLNTITALKADRQIYAVEVAVGDRLLDIMQKYSDTKDLLNKVNKAAERVNAHVDFESGTIVAND